jgi:hypothetical protein
VSGWHAVYLGLAWHYYEQNMVRVKLTGDIAYQHRSHKATQEQIEEVFFKCADLTGKDLHFAQQSAGFAKACVLMYVRLVPMTDEEVAAVQADARQRGTKRLLATIDGHGYLYDRMPTTKEELLEEFENYRDSDFGLIWYDGASAGIARTTRRRSPTGWARGTSSTTNRCRRCTRKASASTAWPSRPATRWA